MRRRALAVLTALALVVVPLSACSASPDREAAIPGDIVVQGTKGAATKVAPCGDYSEQLSCVVDAAQTHATVLNGSSVLFAAADHKPASKVTITKVCWSPAGEVEPSECDTDGKPMTPGLVTQTTISGFPAISLAATKIPDPSPDAPEDGVYPLPAVISLTVDGRDVVVEIACCTTLP